MRKLIFKCGLSPGDIVMLTAAVRDLHLCYPGKFITDVRTSCAELWENNPYISRLDETDKEVEVIDCQYPLIDHSNDLPYHCLHGFIEFFNETLGLSIKPTAFNGDIHLSALEKSWYSQVHELTGEDTPFWIVSAGGKYDVTIKWWATERYQAVIDHFKGKILFVQIGSWGHHHPALRGVIDLRGKTTLRELVRLVYHSQGVLCPVTGLMHLAAAVETRTGQPPHRPAVVIAGGREPMQWEAYPHHQFIHTNGALDCCVHGGCWRDRIVPLGDGTQRDHPDHLCRDVVEDLPRCMHMISPDDVIRRIEMYFQGGMLPFLAPPEWTAAQIAINKNDSVEFDQQPLSVESARIEMKRFIAQIPAYPGHYDGRGIVICGGGEKYLPGAWVCINMLRRLGCWLPVELWHFEGEISKRMESLLQPLKVRCVNATRLREEHPCRILNGWELKCYSILHSAFKEVLFLDADNVPVGNPEFLFDSHEFRSKGAVFWPDYGRFEKTQKIWECCGIRRPHGPEFESGQMLINKEVCWRALRLAMWFNENSDFFYQHLHGDKETFHLAFEALAFPYVFIETPIHPLDGTMCQHDFHANRLFQHRNTLKWVLRGENRPVEDFWYEDECLMFLDQLRLLQDGVHRPARFSKSAGINGHSSSDQTMPAHREQGTNIVASAC
jgi:ADP-heptose:LPS heptosyltransferase